MSNTFNIKVSGLKEGSTTLTITAQADGCTKVSKNVTINVQTNEAEAYDKYTFSVEALRFNGFTINSDALDVDESDKYFLLGGSNTTTNGVVTKASEPSLEFDDEKMLEYILELMQANEPDTSIGTTDKKLSELTNFAGSGLNAFRSWDADKQGYKIKRTSSSSETLQFKNLVYQKETITLEDEPTNEIIYNKTYVSETEHPDFANFVGCWTFDKDKSAVEGIIYVKQSD